MRIGVLGALEVTATSGDTVTITGGRLRALLILLALEPNRVVPTSRLVDGVWDDQPPAGAANALQALVSRLRRAVPDAVIESHPAGYRLAIDPDDVDASRFERLIARKRHREALALWRGDALLDVADSPAFRNQAVRLTELRLTALEDVVAVDPGEAIGLAAEHPLRERLAAAAMRALCASGQPAAALAVFERTRAALADELGADPSTDLTALHLAILRGEYDRPAEVHNLRTALTAFVGRENDVERTTELLGEYRLVTLTGPGGAGKTRLAVESARRMLNRMSDGVWLVELAAATGSEVFQAVSAVFENTTDLVATIRHRELLLILDNCEHVVDAAAALADRLLGDCPRLRILATSREPLGLTGEALWPVEPLALPPTGATAAEAGRYDAMRLLTERARAARPGFALTEANVEALVRICRALDGMPLAVELAAARLRTLSPEHLAERLDDRFRLLTGGSRTALPRHQTLRAVVDWSWDLLAPDERALLRRFAVFVGGAAVEAVEAVCGYSTETLDQLADRSLLVPDGDGRYRMLETIRAYGWERLEQAGERDAVVARHTGYFTGLVEAADPHLRASDQLVWLTRLGADHDNITAALRGAIAAGDAPAALRLVAAAGWYWWLSGHRSDGADLAAAALAMPTASGADDTARAVAYAVAAILGAIGFADDTPVDEWFREAQRLGARAGATSPVLRLAGPLIQVLRGTPPVGDGFELPAPGDDPWLAAAVRLLHGGWLLNVGRHAEAEARLREALDGFRAVGDRWGTSTTITIVADLVAWRGDLTTALALYEEAVAALTGMASREDVVTMRLRVAQLRWLTGDRAGAHEQLVEAEREADRGQWQGVLAAAHGRAELARWAGDVATAEAFLSRAEELVADMSIASPYGAMNLDLRAYLDAAAGDLDAARTHRIAAIDRARLTANVAPVLAHVLVGAADLAVRMGRPEGAARLLAASVAIRGTADLSNPDAVRVDEQTRAALSEPELARAAREGAEATIDTVPAMVAAVLTSPDPG